ncbi:unnamed protein product [Sympodiomycopsis kandeliae]
MFAPMSSGSDEWPASGATLPRSTQAPAGPSSASSSSATPNIIAAQLARTRSPPPQPSGGPPDRVLSSGRTAGQGVRELFAWRSRPESNQPQHSLYEEVPRRRGGDGGKGKGKTKGKGKARWLGLQDAEATLQPTGWNQPLTTETDPLLRPPQPRLGRSRQQRQQTRFSDYDTGIIPSASTSSRLSSFGGGLGPARPRKERRWYMDFFRPKRQKVEEVLDHWASRHGLLILLPCVIVWFWCAVPFPKPHPDSPGMPWCDETPDAPWCRPKPNSSLASHKPEDTDANFWFFLLFYYGLYAAVALVYITQLFSLYRLNWWPSALGAKTSYTIFWLLSISSGYVLHRFKWDSLMAAPGAPSEGNESGDSASPTSIDLSPTVSLVRMLASKTRSTLTQCASVIVSSTTSLNLQSSYGGYGDDNDDDDDDDDIQWQRKTLWVGLAFATMAMPALVCLIGLRRSGRQTYRHSLTDMQKAFLERQLARRIPASYIRFLWFIAAIGLSLVALIAGQGYASVYLSTLPHTGLDGTAYVTFWMTTVNLLAVISHWILEDKVRSRALLFANKYYYFLVYFIFYRNLFARLRSFDQFALVQLLSSFWVCIWYPLSMTSLFHRITQYFNPKPKSWEEYVESVGLAFYVRNLAQNTTMIAFLGWVSILHFGKNQHLYPFFAFDDQKDPYNYQLTMLGSGAIWGSELLTSLIARLICKWLFEVDVTNLGLDEFREFPELLPTCLWTTVHVLMDMLLFLIKLNFR